MKLYIEDNQNLPSCIIAQDADPAPSGFTESSGAYDWHAHGPSKIGTVDGLMDWKQLRDIIKGLVQAKAGDDYSSWATLDDNEKLCALMYCPTKVVDSQGYDFFVAECGDAQIAQEYIDNYLDKAESSRKYRYRQVVKYAYQHLGKNDGIQAEDDAVAERVDSRFLKRGVLNSVEDGIGGLEEWIDGTGDYTVTGLKVKLDASTYTIKTAGLDIPTFIGSLKSIVRNGI